MVGSVSTNANVSRERKRNAQYIIAVPWLRFRRSTDVGKGGMATNQARPTEAIENGIVHCNHDVVLCTTTRKPNNTAEVRK